MDKQRNRRHISQWETIKVHNGIVYDADKSEILYEADLGGSIMIRRFLAITSGWPLLSNSGASKFRNPL